MQVACAGAHDGYRAAWGALVHLVGSQPAPVIILYIVSSALRCSGLTASLSHCLTVALPLSHCRTASLPHCLTVLSARCLLQVVAPKKAKLAEAEATYTQVMSGLKAKQAELAGLLAKLAAMEEELAGCTARKAKLEAEINLCR